MIRYEGSYVDSLLIYVHPLEASDMNFQTIWIPKGILANFCQKKTGLEKHSYLKYALDLVILENSCPYVDVGSCSARSTLWFLTNGTLLDTISSLLSADGAFRQKKSLL